eukprot:6205452-Pleurochrysis_carterae.AAC.3
MDGSWERKHAELTRLQSRNGACLPNVGRSRPYSASVETVWKALSPRRNSQGIYYKGIGTELFNSSGGVASVVPFDLFVVNRTQYKPNMAVRNGKRGINGTIDSEDGDFGVINLRDQERCEFEYIFVNGETGAQDNVAT